MRDYIGLRVARFRDLAGLSQKQLAELVGVTREYISMIENGHRPITKRALLYDLAAALGVAATDLTGQPYGVQDRDDLLLYSAVPAIRTALDGPDTPPQPRPLAQLAAETDAAMIARMGCDYPTLARLLPDLVAQTQTLSETGNTDADRDAATDLFIRVALTASLALKPFGWVDLATRLAERAATAATRLGNPVHVAAAQFALAQSVLSGGSRRRSYLIANAAATDAQHLTDDDGRAWYGLLQLHAALASAANGQSPDTHLAEATAAARHTTGDPWHMEFGPTNVAVWRVGIALENGEPQRAPDLAALVDPTHLRTRHRRARLRIDTGRGLYLAGRTDDAVRELLAADELAPTEVRSRPSVLEIVGQLVRDARRGGSPELVALAARCRVDPVGPA